MPRVLRTVLLAAVVVGVLVAVGLVAAGGDDDPSDNAASTPAAPTTSPTTSPEVALAEVDTTTVAVARAGFCDAVPAEAVEAALGAVPSETTAYVDGQPAQVTGEVRDVAHEFGCGWTSPRANARAWVFAPPVTRRAARALVAETREQDGCTPVPAAPAFGAPSVALTCRTGRGVQASFRGLFGDAWLTCTVTGRLGPDEAVERAERWCVAVLTAARAS